MNKKQLLEDDLKYIWRPFTQMKSLEDDSNKPIIIKKGKGIYIEDIDGKKYIDAVSSWWVNTLGHSNKRINKVIAKQAKKIEHVIFGGFSHEPAIRFSKKLISLMNNKLKHVFFSDNGSTAVEVALKMAYQYQVLKGHPEKRKFIALQNSYHGDTLGAVSVGGIDMYHKVYKPLLFEIKQAKSPYCYRCPVKCSNDTCECECLASVEDILKEEAQNIAGIIIEPLVQAAGGMIMYPAKYITKLRTLCDKYNILLIDDEVAMGFYRTGKLFAYEHAGIVPDIICAAKGITAGYMPLSVTVATDEIFNAFYDDDLDGYKTFYHGHSYTAYPLALAVALENLNILEEMNIEEYLKPKIAKFAKELEKFRTHKNVGDIRQTGMVCAIELVKNKQTKEPFSYEDGIGKKIYLEGLKLGAVLRPMWNCIYFITPYIITEKEIEKLTDIAFQALNNVLPQEN
ncbi:MAG: adenosylmethionine--8-amino-7-oxononanoate transaminase [Candidatus Gastranaerophilales bacterium]|nr:adenosylmethionine--8-amino-7-oxononanoate transaminase [Candidatus Gastranaerophilales bacterium]